MRRLIPNMYNVQVKEYLNRDSFSQSCEIIVDKKIIKDKQNNKIQ